MLDKIFDPKKIDKKNYDFEEKNGFFNSELNSSKKNFSIILTYYYLLQLSMLLVAA